MAGPALLGGCGVAAGPTPSSTTLERAPFGEASRVPVELFTLANPGGVQLRFTNYGGVITSIRVPDRQGHVYRRRYGLALETQHFPGSPNHPNFPSTIPRPGQEYHTTTVHTFSTRPR